LLGTAVGAIAAIVAALIAANKADVRAREDRKAEDIRMMDESTNNVRISRYEKVFKEFREYPRWPEHKVSRDNVNKLTGQLTDWYYEGAGGLLAHGVGLRLTSHKSRCLRIF